MTVRKLTQEEWKYHVESAIRRNALQKEREVRNLSIRLKRLIPVPILIGIIASIFLLKIGGWRIFLEQLLSWVIGITLVTTLIASFLKVPK